MKKFYACFTRLAAGTLLGLAALTGARAQNVGIGTTIPTQTLDVNGSLRIRGLNGAGVRLLNTGTDGTVGVSNPLPAVTVLTSPPNLGSVPVSSPEGVAVSGNYLYVSQRTTPNQIRAYDITVPTTLTAVGTPVTGGSALDLLTVNGSYLYVCDITANQLRVYTTASPGTPATPSFVTTVATTGTGPNGAAVAGNFLYIANYYTNNIERFSLANPAAPVSQGLTTVGSGVAGLAALNGYLYAANYGANTLETFALNATTGAIASVNVQTVGSMPNAVATANGLLYLTNSGNNTLQTFSLANPAVPASQGTVPTGGQPYGFAVKGNYAYISNLSSGTVEVRQLTLSNALGFDGNGALTSVPSTALGDNLGNHTATTSLNLNGNLLVGGTLGTPGTTGLFVNPAGQVGINNLTPAQALDVTGNAQVSGNVTAGNTITASANIAAGGNVTASGNVTAAGNVVATAAVTAATVTTTGTITAGSNVQVPAANAYRYAAPKAYSVTLGASDFQPENNAAANGKLLYSGGASDEFYPSAANGVLRAPLHLPQGAVITNVTLVYYDSSTSDLTLTLNALAPSLTGSSSFTVAGTLTPTGTPSYTNATLTPGSTVTINNNNLYFLRATYPTSSITLTITAVRVNYTVTQTE